MKDSFYEVYKRQVLGREMYSEDEDNKRVQALNSEYSKWESMHGDKRRVVPIGPIHEKTAKDQSRWLKEMDVHAADPKRMAEMQYAAKHGLDYPLKKKPAPARSKRKEMAVSKAEEKFSTKHSYALHPDKGLNRHMNVKARESVRWAKANKKTHDDAYNHWAENIDNKKYWATEAKRNKDPEMASYGIPWTETLGDAAGSEEGYHYMAHALNKGKYNNGWDKEDRVSPMPTRVSKSAFGVDHEEITKWNPVSAAGKAIMALRKPAAAGAHAQVSATQRAGQIARNAPKPGQTSAAQVLARRQAMTSPRANPVAAAPRPPAATSTNVAPSAGTQAVHLNNGNAGPAPSPKGKGGGKKKGGGNSGTNGFMDWAKTNSLSRNAAIGAGIGGVGAMGYGAAKLDGRN